MNKYVFLKVCKMYCVSVTAKQPEILCSSIATYGR